MKKLILILLALCTPFAGLAQEPSLVNSNGAQIDTTAERESFRDALQAQSTSVGFLNRFGRLANGTAVAQGSTPEVGENAYIWWGSGTANPTVVNEALEAAAGTLIYYGANVRSPGNKFSITVIAELRLNASYTGGTTAPDLTLGVNSKAWSSVGGLPSFLSSPAPLHAQVRTSGEVGADFYQEAPFITGDDGGTAFTGQVIGKKFPIRMEVDGNNDTCRITVAGRTRVFRDDRYSRCIGATQTGFFVEWDAPSSSTQYYWAIHSIIANAPELEDKAAFEVGPYGMFLHDLTTRGLTEFPGRYRILNGTTFNASQAPGANDPLGITGNPMVGYAPYAMPSPFLTSRLGGIIQRNTAALTSSAPATDQQLHTIANMEALASSTGAQFSAGAFWKTTYYGRFGANANTKRLKIIRDAGGATRFDSGDITDNGAEFTLTHIEKRNGSGYIFITTLEWSVPGNTAAKRIQTYNAASSIGLNNRLYVTGTAAGDVTIDHHWTEAHPNP